MHFELLERLDAHGIEARVVAALALGFGAVQAVAFAIGQPAGDAVVVGGPEDTRHQLDERRRATQSAADRQGQILERRRCHDSPQIRPLRLEQWSRRSDFHRLIDRPDRQGYVHAGDSVHLHSHIDGFGFPEARLFCGDDVTSHRQVDNAVHPVGARPHSLCQPGVDVPRGDDGIGHRGSGWVTHCSPDCTSILSEPQGCKAEQQHR